MHCTLIQHPTSFQEFLYPHARLVWVSPFYTCTCYKGSLQSLDWTSGLDWWTGLVDWTGGLDWWTDIFYAKNHFCDL